MDAVYQIVSEAIEEKDWMQLVIGGVFVFAAYQAVEQALPVCESVDTVAANWTTYNKIGMSLKTDLKSVLLSNLSGLAAVAEEVQSGDF